METIRAAPSPAPPEEGRTAAPERERFGHPEVFALICALSFLTARFLPLLELGYPCPFRELTGWPCATCGMTHAFVYLAHGDVWRAVTANPLGALLALGAWSFAVADLLRVLAALPLPRLGARGARTAARLGIAAVAANWLFVLLARTP